MNYNEIIEDICYIYLNIPDNRILSRSKIAFLNIFKVFIRNIYSSFRYNESRIIGKINDEIIDLSGSNWIITNSINTYRSLKFLENKIDNSLFISTSLLTRFNTKKPHIIISFHSPRIHIVKFLKTLVYLSRKYSFSKILRLFDVIYDSIISLESSLNLFDTHAPNVVIFSNDHIYKLRALLNAARIKNIKTVYIQHASISKYFPPLRFNLNLLEGQHAYKNYSINKKITGEVQLIGMPKFDSFIKFRREIKYIKVIAVCGNLLDNPIEIEKLINSLVSYYPNFTLIFRPHPRDKRKYKLHNRTVLSDSRKENSFEFLKKVDILIGSNSNIHLEATMMNIQCIYYEFGKPIVKDYYEFVSNKLAKKAKSLNDIKDIISNYKPNEFHYLKSKFYVETLGSNVEGKSSELSIYAIQKLLNE